MAPIISAFAVVGDALKSNVFFLSFSAVYGAVFWVVSTICIQELCTARFSVFWSGIGLAALAVVFAFFDDKNGKTTFRPQAWAIHRRNQSHFGDSVAIDNKKPASFRIRHAVIVIQAFTNGVTLAAIVVVSATAANWFAVGNAPAASCFSAPQLTPAPPNITELAAGGCQLEACQGCSTELTSASIGLTVTALVLFIVRAGLNADILSKAASYEKAKSKAQINKRFAYIEKLAEGAEQKLEELKLLDEIATYMAPNGRDAYIAART